MLGQPTPNDADPTRRIRRTLVAARRGSFWDAQGPRRVIQVCRDDATPHRIFTWLPTEVLPDSHLIVFAYQDDYHFGVLHSRFHGIWSRSTAGAQRREAVSGLTYTPTTCFETFPLPHPTDAQRDAIAEVARDLDRLRNGWLNPPGLSDADLAKRTLTNLYNAMPTWLAQAHQRLDAAALAAYGWPSDITSQEMLGRLLELNLTRAGDAPKR
jgi:hypothetical protein